MVWKHVILDYTNRSNIMEYLDLNSMLDSTFDTPDEKVNLHGWDPVSLQLLYFHQFCWAPCRLFRRSLSRSSRWFPRCQWDLESCQRQWISLIVETSSEEISYERNTHGSQLEKIRTIETAVCTGWCAYTYFNPRENLVLSVKSSAEEHRKLLSF